MIDRADVVRITEGVISQLRLQVVQSKTTTTIELLYDGVTIDSCIIDNNRYNETDPLKK